MIALPSMWRVELIHPMLVHLPLVLLTGGTILWLVGQGVDAEGTWGFFEPAGRLALIVGTLGAWLAIYTGDLADSEVVRTLCDPTVVEAHEEYAYLAAYLFTGAVVVEGASASIETLGAWRRVAAILVAIALLAGSGLLGYVGHLGARLVYQQGAAVHHPSEDCAEFVD